MPTNVTETIFEPPIVRAPKASAVAAPTLSAKPLRRPFYEVAASKGWEQEPVKAKPVRVYPGQRPPATAAVVVNPPSRKLKQLQVFMRWAEGRYVSDAEFDLAVKRFETECIFR